MAGFCLLVVRKVAIKTCTEEGDACVLTGDCISTVGILVVAICIIVIDIFVPVSPSGTGKTFSSLIHSFFASRFFAPARNILDSVSVLMLVISNFVSSLINYANAFDVDIDLIDFHTGK